MPAPRDADNILRAGATDLTSDETLTHTIPGNAYTVPLGVSVLLPQAPGASNTLTVTAKITTADEKIEVTHTDSLGNDHTYPLTIHLPLPLTHGTALSVVLDVTEGGSNLNFGKAQVWLERSDFAIVPVTSP